MVVAGRPVRFALPDASRSSTAIIGLVPKTGFPVAANASTDDTDHQSVISSDSVPSIISGAMNPASHHQTGTRHMAFAFAHAMPKSTRTGPVAETITLVGLMSRCTMPAA